MDKPAFDGLHPFSRVGSWSGFPNDAMSDLEFVKFRFHRTGVGSLFFRSAGRGLPVPFGKVYELGLQYVSRQENGPFVEVITQLLGFLDLGREKLRVDGATVDLLQRHPPFRENPVKLDDPAHEIGIGLLPKRFLALAEQLLSKLETV